MSSSSLAPTFLISSPTGTPVTSPTAAARTISAVIDPNAAKIDDLREQIAEVQQALLCIKKESTKAPLRTGLATLQAELDTLLSPKITGITHTVHGPIHAGKFLYIRYERYTPLSYAKWNAPGKAMVDFVFGLASAVNILNGEQPVGKDVFVPDGALADENIDYIMNYIIGDTVVRLQFHRFENSKLKSLKTRKFNFDKAININIPTIHFIFLNNDFAPLVLSQTRNIDFFFFDEVAPAPAPVPVPIVPAPVPVPIVPAPVPVPAPAPVQVPVPIVPAPAPAPVVASASAVASTQVLDYTGIIEKMRTWFDVISSIVRGTLNGNFTVQNVSDVTKARDAIRNLYSDLIDADNTVEDEDARGVSTNEAYMQEAKRHLEYAESTLKDIKRSSNKRTGASASLRLVQSAVRHSAEHLRRNTDMIFRNNPPYETKEKEVKSDSVQSSSSSSSSVDQYTKYSPQTNASELVVTTLMTPAEFRSKCIFGFRYKGILMRYDGKDKLTQQLPNGDWAFYNP